MTDRQFKALCWLVSVGKASEKAIEREGFARRTFDVLADAGLVQRDWLTSYGIPAGVVYRATEVSRLRCRHESFQQ